jgi:Raf kinase inhibitor-like YbhB/YbcL family protein
MTLTLGSSAFSNNGSIPEEYTCDGPDVSPPLEWKGAPAGTKSFALIVDDPDAPDPKAPKRVYVHWVVYDIPPSVTKIDRGASPKGARIGTNDWKKAAWGGPCPPIGRHRYFFKLYALDKTLGDLGAPTKSNVEEAMRGHVLEQVELVGTYEHPKGAGKK